MSDTLFGPSDIDDLNYTRSLRRKALETLVDEDNPLPDRKYNRFFIDLIDGLDRQILSKASIKTQDEQNKRTAELAAHILREMKTVETTLTERKQAPTKTKKVDPMDVPGELSIGETDISLDQIIK